jgi:RNA polymerase sigma-70 factor (ECF subfamily)
MTLAAVNSALQRARATLHDNAAAHERFVERSRGDEDTAKRVLDRYIRAWEAADADALVQLLTDDAAFSMPPAVIWYRGHAAIRGFLTTVPFEGNSEGRWQCRLTRANLQPALAIYQLDPETSIYQAAALQTLALQGGRVTDVITFLNETNFVHFGLPPELDPDHN